MDLIVVYDIATENKKDAKRLRLVAHVCEGFGVRVQDSVFECRLSAIALEQFKIELEDTIDEGRDSVYLYHLNGELRNARTRLGAREPHEAGTPWLL